MGVGVAGAAGVVGSGSAPSLWEPGNKGPYSAKAALCLPCLGRLPSGKGTVGCWAELPGSLSLWHGPQCGARGGGTGRNEPGTGSGKCSKRREEAEQKSRDRRDETHLISCSKVIVAGGGGVCV